MSSERRMKTGSKAAKPRPKKNPASLSAFELLLFDISTRFIALPVDRLDSEILRAQREVCECLGLDISSLWQMPPNDPSSLISTHVYVPPDYDVPVPEMDAQDLFPWSMVKLARGETVVLSRMTDIPPEGARDLEIFRYYRIQSSICFPLSAGRAPMFGAVAFDTYRKPVTWTGELIDKLGLVAQVFANALFRKRAEETLAKKQSLIAEIEKIGKVGGWEIDIETMKQTWTAEIYNIHEVAPTFEPTVDKGIQFYTPASRPVIERLVRRAIEHGEPFDAELEIITARGRLRAVHAVGRADLKNRRVYGFFQDITERKHAELLLAESEKRYRTLFELVPAGISVVGTDGYVRMANALQAQLYGYESPQQLDGFYAPLFIVEGERERASRDMSAVAEGSGLIRRIYTAVRRDGSEFTAEVTGAVVQGPNQEVQGYLFLTCNVTKSQQDESEMAQMRFDLTHLARVLTVDEISTSLAHEINQPLGAILNNAEAARTLLTRGEDKREVFSEIVEDIIQDALRAGEVVRKVRRVLKKGEVRFERLPVNGLIAETLEILGSNLALNNVTLRLELAPDLADISGDRIRLQQVVLNLATNAVEAMKEAPAKALTVRSAMKAPDLITVSVSDSGPGIVEAERELLFQPFFTTKKEGLGLGLSICRSIIEEHGGRIWIEDAPGAGTTVSFSLKAWTDNFP